jgi:uncharacterized membrane protein
MMRRLRSHDRQRSKEVVMTGYSDEADVARRHAQGATNLTYAGIFLVISGGISIVQGAIAQVNGTYFTVARQSIMTSDPETWGWVQLVSGAVILVAGIAVLRRAPWARPVAMALAAISIAAQIFYFPGHVFGSMLVVAANGLVIGALAAAGVFERDD